MIRIWQIFLAATLVLWGIPFVDWSQSGIWNALTVGEVLASLGLPALQPPPTAWGQVAAGLLRSDGGVVCLVVTMAALAYDAIFPHHS